MNLRKQRQLARRNAPLGINPKGERLMRQGATFAKALPQKTGSNQTVTVMNSGNKFKGTRQGIRVPLAKKAWHPKNYAVSAKSLSGTMWA